MKEIVLDGAGWKTEGDFYDAFFEGVGAPRWHGRNLNALNDSIGAGGVNRIEVPYAVRIKGLSAMSDEAREIVGHFAALVRSLKEEGVPVEVSLE
ncbi:MAG TPA: barstar family protein [Pyrinomonadaceae bacterium]|nr:barstar family protein [Pyrinomonadaceae bacterium]